MKLKLDPLKLETLSNKEIQLEVGLISKEVLKVLND